MPPPLVLTRPAADSTRWAVALRAAGIDVHMLPLLEIVPPDDLAPLRQAWAALPRYAAVFFVSSNAVRHFFEPNVAGALVNAALFATNTRAWAPGPGTAAALRAAGVTPDCIDQPAPDAAQFDSESLWRVVHNKLQPGQHVLIVRGLDRQGQPAGRDWFAQQLQQAGMRVDQVGAYRRRAPCWQEPDRALAQTALQERACWLFSSAEAVGNLKVLLNAEQRAELAFASAIATHPRVALATRAAGFTVVRESQPTVASVLASIKSQG